MPCHIDEVILKLTIHYTTHRRAILPNILKDLFVFGEPALTPDDVAYSGAVDVSGLPTLLRDLRPLPTCMDPQHLPAYVNNQFNQNLMELRIGLEYGALLRIYLRGDTSAGFSFPSRMATP